MGCRHRLALALGLGFLAGTGFWVRADSPADLPPAFDVRPYTACFVSIEGEPRNGIGFVAKLRDGIAVVTQARVIDGESRFAARTGSGIEVHEDHLLFADNADIARIEDAKLASGLAIVDPVDATVNIGDDVVVLGNNNGGGTAIPIPGRVTAIGPDAVDIDAPFAPADSGGPVIHVKTGKVIGVAAYLRIRQIDPDDATGTALQMTERRCAYRLDTVSHWTEVDPPLFARAGGTVAALALRTRWLAHLSDDLQTHGAVHYDDYLPEGNPLRDLVGRFRDDMIDRKSNGGTFLQAKQNFLLFAADDCGNDIFSLRPGQLDPYHQRRLQQLIRERQELSAFFNALSAQQDEGEGFNTRFRRRVEGNWTPVPEQNEYPADYPPLTPSPQIIILPNQRRDGFRPTPGTTNSIPPWHH